MKKLIKNLILFLIIANFNCAFCYVLTKEELKSDLTYKINEELKTTLKGNDDFKFSINGIPFEKTITKDINKPKIELISQNNNFSQNLYKRVLIKDLSGNTVKSFPINIRTYVYKEVLVATNNIPFNQEINSTNSKLERKEISRYIDKTISKEMNGYISKRNYQTGNIIFSNGIKQKSTILKNSSINIVFESKNVNIKVKGRALKDGSVGETILVRTDKYNKTYNAVINNQNEAVVRI